MTSQRFAEALNEQIGYEFSASQQYIAIAVYYDAETLPQLAAHFFRQAVEERNHAMMMVQYLLDAEAEVSIPGISPPRTEFASVTEPVKLALEQERRVTDQISELTKLARDESDYQAEQFLQWFLKEQLEETSGMSDLLAIVERAAGPNVLLVEEYLARTQLGDGGDDAGAPEPAGGAL